ncbi:uncharacterized protein LOC143504063 [Brachyhypopomus gauderio]|uniref:uncharacterized protein LOC143504063 n=1 Tax=Brachyhypopomus gauderio TaxID=698409 RepID=UPI004042CA13
MPPRKQMATTKDANEGDIRGERELQLHSEIPDRECSTTEPTEKESVAQLGEMLHSFIKLQQVREERHEKQTQKQEQRWRMLQHQFTQLQSHIQGEQEQPSATEGETSQQSEVPATLATLPEVQIIHRVQRTVTHDPAPLNQRPMCLGWTSPKMLPFREDEDIEHYLTTFERIAQAGRWPREDWTLHLVPLLSGKARAAYVAMDIEDTADYEQVKWVLLQKYEINAETYRWRFRDNAVKDGETPRELQARLRDLYDEWMTPKQKTKEEIGDAVVMEQFLQSINPEIRTWIKQHTLTTSRHAAELSENYIAARQPNRSVQLGHPSSATQGKPREAYKSGITKWRTAVRIRTRTPSWTQSHS